MIFVNNDNKKCMIYKYENCQFLLKTGNRYKNLSLTMRLYDVNKNVMLYRHCKSQWKIYIVINEL